MEELLEIKLLKLVNDYFKSKKEVDLKFIDEVFDISIKALDLDDYVLNVYITDESKSNLKDIVRGSYTALDKSITINTSGILYICNTLTHKLVLNSDELILLVYDAFISSILHELEHARQLKKVNSNKLDIETKLLSVYYGNINELEEAYLNMKRHKYLLKSLKAYLGFVLKTRRYDLAYNFSPHEKLAEKFSILHILRLNKNLGLTESNLNSYYQYLYYLNLLSGYDLVKVPIYHYLTIMKENNLWETIEKLSKNLDIDTRLSLGFEITELQLSTLYLEGINLYNKVRRL